MSLRIFLVRHGESMGNVDQSLHQTKADHQIPLSERGREQAVLAGQMISQYLMKTFHTRIGVLPEFPSLSPAKKPHVRLWYSPYKRTQETRDGIIVGAQEWITDTKENAALCEQQFGLFDGIADEDLATLFPLEYAHYKKQLDQEGKFWARMPQGESRFDVVNRVHQTFGTFHRDAEYNHIRNIIVVCHGVTLRAFLMRWMNYPTGWFECEPNPNNCAIRLIEDNCDRGWLFQGFPRSENNG